MGGTVVERMGRNRPCVPLRVTGLVRATRCDRALATIMAPSGVAWVKVSLARTSELLRRSYQIAKGRASRAEGATPAAGVRSTLRGARMQSVPGARRWVSHRTSARSAGMLLAACRCRAGIARHLSVLPAARDACFAGGQAEKRASLRRRARSRAVGCGPTAGRWSGLGCGGGLAWRIRRSMWSRLRKKWGKRGETKRNGRSGQDVQAARRTSRLGRVSSKAGSGGRGSLQGFLLRVFLCDSGCVQCAR